MLFVGDFAVYTGPKVLSSITVVCLTEKIFKLDKLLSGYSVVGH
jgi:hypothetical protein